MTTDGHNATRLGWCDACAEHVMPGHVHFGSRTANAFDYASVARVVAVRAADIFVGGRRREAYEADPHGFDGRREADGSPVRLAETE